MVGIGKGRVVEVWQDLVSKGAEKQKAPYLSQQVGGDVSRVVFCPFEDCLGIGHANGFSSMIVPGMSCGRGMCIVLCGRDMWVWQVCHRSSPVHCCDHVIVM